MFQVGWLMTGPASGERVAWLVGLMPGKVDENALACCNAMGAFRE